MQTVGERCGRGFVHQAKNFESRNLPGVFRGLALGVVEICGHGDDCTADGFAEKRFRPILQLTQNERGNLRRCKDFVAEPHANHITAGWIKSERKELQFVLDVFYAAAHQAFDRVDGAFGLREQGRRAASPTMIFPSGSRLTMDGQSVEPCGPSIHFGVFVRGSRYATRLLVVPRSIPTMRPMSVSSDRRPVAGEIFAKHYAASPFSTLATRLRM